MEYLNTDLSQQTPTEGSKQTTELQLAASRDPEGLIEEWWEEE